MLARSSSSSSSCSCCSCISWPYFCIFQAGLSKIHYKYKLFHIICCFLWQSHLVPISCEMLATVVSILCPEFVGYILRHPCSQQQQQWIGVQRSLLSGSRSFCKSSNGTGTLVSSSILVSAWQVAKKMRVFLMIFSSRRFRKHGNMELGFPAGVHLRTYDRWQYSGTMFPWNLMKMLGKEHAASGLERNCMAAIYANKAFLATTGKLKMKPRYPGSCPLHRSVAVWAARELPKGQGCKVCPWFKFYI